MFLGNYTVTGKWIKFSNLVGVVDETATYFIQNNGSFNIIFRESKEAPTKKEDNGLVLYVGAIAEYKKGSSELYLKIMDYPKLKGMVSISNNK